MHAVAIAVDAARDAAHRAHTDAAESYAARYTRACDEVFAEIAAADAERLGEIVWSALDGINDSKLHLLDEVFAAVRDLTSVEFGPSAERELAAAAVINRWRFAVASAVVRIVDNRMREDGQ